MIIAIIKDDQGGVRNHISVIRDTVQYITIQHKTAQYNTTQTTTIQYNTTTWKIHIHDSPPSVVNEP